VLGAPGRRAQGPVPQDLRERNPHLHLGERGADAAPHAAAERDPGEARGRAVEEALGPEGQRLGIAVGAGVGEPDRRRHVRSGRQQIFVDAERRGQPAPGQRDHRPQSQGLADDRARVRLLAGVGLGDEALEHRRVPHEEVERPRQARRRRFVPRDQQGHELIADLGVVHRLAVLEACRHEHREDVLARVRATLGDLQVQQRVDLAPQALESRQRVGPTDAPRQQDGELQAGGRGLREQAAEPVGQPLPALGVGHAEHRAQDHLERHALHALVDRERLALGPRLDLARDDVTDRRLIGAHARAVERRQHEPPARQVLAALEQQE
jgi:hypothetical protein